MRVVTAIGVLSLLVGAGFVVSRRFVRYAIEGESMSPALRPGDFVVVDRTAFRRREPRLGEIVLARDPRQPERTLVKRVSARLPGGLLDLRGDNSYESTDSRHFGPVPAEMVAGKVVFRYWPLPGGRRE